VRLTAKESGPAGRFQRVGAGGPAPRAGVRGAGSGGPGASGRKGWRDWGRLGRTRGGVAGRAGATGPAREDRGGRTCGQYCCGEGGRARSGRLNCRVGEGASGAPASHRRCRLKSERTQCRKGARSSRCDANVVLPRAPRIQFGAQHPVSAWDREWQTLADSYLNARAKMCVDLTSDRDVDDGPQPPRRTHGDRPLFFGGPRCVRRLPEWR
jgi:hypothetical protein